MSKHISRKDKWVEINSQRYDGIYGYVQQNSFGMWDAVLVYRKRPPLTTPEFKERSFKRYSKPCGEFKRAREAMSAVEQMATKLISLKNPDIII